MATLRPLTRFPLRQLRTQIRPLSTTPHLRTAAPPPPFDPEDALLMREMLSEDERAISQVARDYCQEKLAPRILQAYRDEHYDRNILLEMGELGFLGATINGYGCAGVNNVASGLITREVERIDSGYRSSMSVQSSLVMHPIHEFGSPALKERLLPQLASGRLIGCFGLTEPNHGSDPGSLETTAREHPTKKGIYLLNGSKTWITNAPIADVLLIWAKLDGQIRGFVIERSTAGPGLTTPKISNKLGLRASITGMIHLSDVSVPAENILTPSGLKGPFTCLNSARYGIAWGVIGALEDCLHRARTYSIERKQFKNQPLARYQLVQKKLADAASDVAYGLAVALQAGRLKDAGKLNEVGISLVKRGNCDLALRGARSLQEILGGNAVADEYHIGRHVQNLFVAQTYEGQSDIHSLILGRALTGVQAFC